MKNFRLKIILVVIVFVMQFTGCSVASSETAALIAPTEAAQLARKKAAIIVDVRQSDEWRSGHIPDAKHIPLDQLKSRLGELEQYKDRPIIMQCQGGVRSAKAAQMLKQVGFSQVYDLKGGINAWNKAGFPNN